MKNGVFFLCCLVIFLSCREKKTEVVDLKDLVSTSDKYKEGETEKEDTVDFQLYDSLNREEQQLTDTLGMGKENIQWIDSLWLPDRFKHQNARKWSGEMNSFAAKIAVWTYSDSLTLKNGLFNWWDCFGKRCQSLQLWEEKKLSSESLVFYVSDKKVIFMSVDGPISEKKILENLTKLYPKVEPKFVLTQLAGKKTQWWERKEKKWAVIKPKIG